MGVRVIDPATERQLPDGIQYRGPKQYRARKLLHGKRVTRTFDTARQAADWLASVEVDRRRGVFVDLSEAEKKTLGDVLTRYMHEVLGDDSEKDGAEREAGMIGVILRDPVCSIKMARLQGADVAGLRDRMKAVGYAPSTIVRRLNLIQTAINHARREWRINIVNNPASADRCARPKGADRKRDRILLPAQKQRVDQLDQAGAELPAVELPPPCEAISPDTGDVHAEMLLSEEERLLGACRSDRSPWLLPATQLALLTAMRQGEICALEWSDIDFEARTIDIRGPERQNGMRSTKNGETRTIPFLPGVEEVLGRLDRGRDPRVIKIGQNALKMRFRRSVAQAGLKDLTFHDLRHVATSRLARIFRDPLRLRLVTGHKDLKTLARYFHKTPQELAEEAGLVPRVRLEERLPENDRECQAGVAQSDKTAA
jgi:integrase